MASENKDENRGLFSSLGGFSRGEKSYWWLPFAFLFLFLAAGGFYAWNAMKGAAHKLAGGDSYNSLSADSAGYGGGSYAKKEDNFFASDEDLSSPSGKKAGKALLAASLAPGAGAQVSAGPAGSAGQEAEYLENPESGASVYRASGGQSSTLQSKLQASPPKADGMKGGQTSKYTGFNDESGGEKPSVAPVASTGKNPDGQASKKGPGTSVIESLKSAFKSSLYGARLTSQDAASAWIAKSFTAAPDAEMALQYDEKMRSKLDKVNPNSIPNFLRNQDINAAEAKTLGVSEVHKPDADKDATKDALEDDKDYQAKKAAKDMASGVINPMFSGMDFGGENSRDVTDPTDRDITDEKALPEDLSYMDEYGYAHISGPDGMEYIFDEDGAIVGCEDINAGMCVMPGSGSCPSDLYFI